MRFGLPNDSGWRRLMWLCLAVVVSAATPAVTAAAAVGTITYGPCQTTATIAGSSVDLATLSTWHLRSTDRPTIVVSGPFQIMSATPPVRSYWLAALGVTREIDRGAGPPGTVANIDLSSERLLGPRFDLSEFLAGPADGDQCSWFPPVVLDDVNPLLTVFGGGALMIALLAALAVLGSIRTRSRLWLRFVLGVIGGAGVIGGWSALEQFGIVPWRDHGPGLYLLPIGFIAGFVLVGLGARSRSSQLGDAT